MGTSEAKPPVNDAQPPAEIGKTFREIPPNYTLSLKISTSSDGSGPCEISVTDVLDGYTAKGGGSGGNAEVDLQLYPSQSPPNSFLTARSGQNVALVGSSNDNPLRSVMPSNNLLQEASAKCSKGTSQVIIKNNSGVEN